MTINKGKINIVNIPQELLDKIKSTKVVVDFESGKYEKHLKKKNQKENKCIYNINI